MRKNRPKVRSSKRKELLLRDGECCVYCGIAVRIRPRRAGGWIEQPNDFSVDHVTPIACGGSNELDNLAVACRRCNNTKAALEKEVFLAIVQRGVRPRPTRIRNVAFVHVPDHVIAETARLTPHPRTQTVADTKFILQHGYKAWRAQFEQRT